MFGIISTLFISAVISIEIVIFMYTVVMLIPDEDDYKRKTIKDTFKSLYYTIFHGTTVFGKITGGIFFILSIPGILATILFEIIRVVCVFLSDLRYK